jgi:hydrogenase maturation protein HypF
VESAFEVRLRGRVQGVGLRPAVWRFAQARGLRGDVRNDGEGVLIRLNASLSLVEDWIADFRRHAPPLARIDSIEIRPLASPIECIDFAILESDPGLPGTEIAPDIAMCAACRAETLDPNGRRFRYPFTNCTECGPRLSIVRGQPYDRALTSMAPFAMCAACQAEYDDPRDRRFHAQPIACPACGPTIRLEALRQPLPEDLLRMGTDAIAAAARLIGAGAIVAIKGLGGFHLACDATNVAAVAELRARKRRDAKPFAVMLRDVAMVRRYAALSSAEEAGLTSGEAPIVLLAASGPERLAPSIAPAMVTIGAMLPATPLQLLLCEACNSPLVMTSGNLSDEPPAIENEDARTRLGSIADAILLHDRAIANRVDDSVVRAQGGRVRLLRRARGFAPAGIALPAGFEAAPEGISFGAELKATFCMTRRGQAYLSPHIGDLESALSLDDYRKNLALYRGLFDPKPAFLALDMHPDYLSRQIAGELAAETSAPLFEVQHHHAHIASCLADNGVALDAPAVLGIAFDGLGYGDDATLWGGEILHADYRGYRRIATIRSIPLLGGAQAIREPWRALYAHLRQAFGWQEFAERYRALPVVEALASKPLQTLDRMAERGVNAPPTSSCGRLFDAVAAAIGIGFERASYEGQPAIELEAAAARHAAIGARNEGYSFARTVAGRECLPALDPAPMWRQLFEDLRRSEQPGAIALRFHLGLVRATAELAVEASGNLPDERRVAALSGGCFQNAILCEWLERELEAVGFRVLTHAAVPAGDGGLALGQAVVAAARLLARN